MRHFQRSCFDYIFFCEDISHLSPIIAHSFNKSLSTCGSIQRKHPWFNIHHILSDVPQVYKSHLHNLSDFWEFCGWSYQETHEAEVVFISDCIITSWCIPCIYIYMESLPQSQKLDNKCSHRHGDILAIISGEGKIVLDIHNDQIYMYTCIMYICNDSLLIQRWSKPLMWQSKGLTILRFHTIFRTCAINGQWRLMEINRDK